MSDITIYVVTENEYDYESSSSIPILATFTKAKAEAKVAEMLVKQATRVTNNATLMAHMLQWEKDNPRPRPTQAEQKVLPDYGPKRHKWSPEQLAEYKAVKQSNLDKQAAAIKPHSDWALTRMAEQNAFKKTFSDVDQDDWYISEKLCWEIEEVPYEE